MRDIAIGLGLGVIGGALFVGLHAIADALRLQKKVVIDWNPKIELHQSATPGSTPSAHPDGEKT